MPQCTMPLTNPFDIAVPQFYRLFCVIAEFRRIDSNDDDQVTFSEFLLGDRSYIEEQSRYFHGLDLNGDGRVTRKVGSSNRTEPY